MKKIVFLLVLFVSFAFAESALAAYVEVTNTGGAIDWANIIEGSMERDYRDVSTTSHTPFEFTFEEFSPAADNGFMMTLRHSGNRYSDRENWQLYFNNSGSLTLLGELDYSNDWGEGWIGWVDQAFFISSELAAGADTFTFVLDAGGTDRRQVISLDNAEISAVPLPGAIWLLGPAVCGMFGFRKKGKKS